MPNSFNLAELGALISAGQFYRIRPGLRIEFNAKLD